MTRGKKEINAWLDAPDSEVLYMFLCEREEIKMRLRALQEQRRDYGGFVSDREESLIWQFHSLTQVIVRMVDTQEAKKRKTMSSVQEISPIHRLKQMIHLIRS